MWALFEYLSIKKLQEIKFIRSIEVDLLQSCYNHYDTLLREHFDGTSLTDNHNFPCDLWVQDNLTMATSNHQHFLYVLNRLCEMTPHLVDAEKIFCWCCYWLVDLIDDFHLQHFLPGDSFHFYQTQSLNIIKIINALAI